MFANNIIDLAMICIIINIVGIRHKSHNNPSCHLSMFFLQTNRFCHGVCQAVMACNAAFNATHEINNKIYYVVVKSVIFKYVYL